MNEKFLFVGQAPSRETDGKPPFTGKCGVFLAELLGTTQIEMLEKYEFRNVLDRWPGKGIKGDKFPVQEASIAAKKMLEEIKGRAVCLLGANVARAFGIKHFRYLEKYEIRNPENASEVWLPLVVIVPHPSRINRYWNAPENTLIVEKFFQGLLANYPETKPQNLS
jgi:uracil-DNA glycosylase